MLAPPGPPAADNEAGPPEGGKTPTMAEFLGQVPELSEFQKLVGRCGSASTFGRSDGLAPLLPLNEAFARMPAAERQRLEADVSYCRRVVACHAAGFDCVAAYDSQASLAGGVNGAGNVVSYTMAGVVGRATDVEVSNGVPLVTPALLPLPAADVAPGPVSGAVIEAHRVSHAHGTHDVPPPPSMVTSVVGALQTRPDLTDFRSLLAEAQVRMPVEGGKHIVLAIPNEVLRKMPAARLDKLRADKATLRRVLECHLAPIACFKVKRIQVEDSKDASGLRFGNLVGSFTAAKRLDDGLVLLVDDFAVPPKDFHPVTR